MSDELIMLIVAGVMCISWSILCVSIFLIKKEFLNKKQSYLVKDSERLYQLYKQKHPEATRDITIGEVIKGLKR